MLEGLSGDRVWESWTDLELVDWVDYGTGGKSADTVRVFFPQADLHE